MTKKNPDAFEHYAARATNKKRPWKTEGQEVEEVTPVAEEVKPVHEQTPVKSKKHVTKNTPDEILEAIIGLQKGISLKDHRGFHLRWRAMPSKFEHRERKSILALVEQYPDDVIRLYNALIKLEAMDVPSPIGVIESSWDKIRLSFNAYD